MSNPSEGQLPLRLLALDGGGVRGLVTLLLLRRLLYTIDSQNPPKPCEVFDIIAGTSTGGLLAIMLGRLELDIETAISAYSSLSQTIFTTRKRTWLGGKKLHNLMGSATFDAGNLEKAIKKVLKDSLGDESASLYQDNPKCKIFVCTTLSNGKPLLLRNYHAKSEERMPCTIWEAARATSAAPTFFDPIKFSNGVVFRDGAFRNNNPIFVLIDEAKIEFGARDISVIVSLGTGLSKSIELGSGLLSVAKACAQIALDTEAQADRFVETYCDIGGQYRDKYFRFDVPNGIQGVGIEEWKKHDIMWVNTLDHLHKAGERERLKACAEKIKGSRAWNEVRLPVAISCSDPSSSRISRDSQILSESKPKPAAGSTAPSDDDKSSESEQQCQDLGMVRWQSGTKSGGGSYFESHPFYQLDRIGKQPVRHFAEREETFILQKLLKRTTEKGAVQVRYASLIGFGGSGKTQLMLQYASMMRESYEVVLWFDVQSEDQLLASFERAAGQLGLILPAHSTEASFDPGQALVKRQALHLANVFAIKAELKRRKQRWLLLFDGADDLDIIDFLPQCFPSDSSGSIIISSRRSEAYRLGDSVDVKGLPTESARDLLLHHAGIQAADDKQISEAEAVVKQLDCIALAIDLAGTYIRSLGSLETYLTLYKTKKEELVMRAIGKNFPIATGYKESVFTAWKVSIEGLRPQVAQFLYLLCFLDSTNLNKELFRRACSSKSYWDDNGNISSLQPSMSYVPQWLINLFCNDLGEWSDFEFHATTKALSSVFFLSKEEHTGTWLHETGPVDSESLAQHGPLTVLKLPQPLHDLGKQYLSQEDCQRYCFDSFFIAMHGFQNDIEVDLGPIRDKEVVMYIGRGGAVREPTTLARQLEETYRHIQSCRDLTRDSTLKHALCFHGLKIPVAERCTALMFASHFWALPAGAMTDLESLHSMWNCTLRLTDLILRGKSNLTANWTIPSNSYTRSQKHEEFEEESINRIKQRFKHYGPGQFEQEWASRRQKYYILAYASDEISRLDLHNNLIYQFAAMAENCFLEKRSLLETLKSMEEWIEKDMLSGFSFKIAIDSSLRFEQWKTSSICNRFIQKTGEANEEEVLIALRKYVPPQIHKIMPGAFARNMQFPPPKTVDPSEYDWGRTEAVHQEHSQKIGLMLGTAFGEPANW